MTSENQINVEYVLLAEFDVDKGVTLRQQYPRPIGKDAEVIGSLMLPDGAHNRELDLVTFLVKVPASDSEDNSEYLKLLEKKRKKGSFLATAYIYKENQDWNFLGDCDKPCTVWIEESSLFIRSPAGIDVKIEMHRGLRYTIDENEMHIVHNKYGIAYALHFPKPESAQVFQKQMQDMQFYTENDELKGYVDEILFSQEEEDAWKIDEVSESRMMYCFCVVKTMKDSTFRRGASMKSIAICSPYPFVHIFKDLIDSALTKYFQDPSESVLAELYDSLNMLDIKAIPRLSPAQKSVCRNLWLKTKKLEKKFEVTFGETKRIVNVPLCHYQDEVGEPSVISLVKKFPQNFMTIFNAILLQKRVLFIGTYSPIHEICSSVLSAILMLAPPLAGVVYRTFPYASLVNVNAVLQTPGFIAGVSNPMFEEKINWWDILCDLQTGRVTVSPSIKFSTLFDLDHGTHTEYDKKIAEQVLFGLSAGFGEERIRSILQGYASQILHAAAGTEIFGDLVEMRAFEEANRTRFVLLVDTDAYLYYSQVQKKRLAVSPLQGFNVAEKAKLLRIQKTLAEEELAIIYESLHSRVQTNAQIVQLLAEFPDVNGGLNPLAFGLLHRNDKIRRMTFDLLLRISDTKIGEKLMHTLNFYLQAAYQRQYTDRSKERSAQEHQPETTE